MLERLEQQTLRKFSDQHLCVDGKERASVQLQELQTLWFNTGTLCNLACAGCYIESSPKNDRLVYLTFEEIYNYLIELIEGNYGTQEIGFTGGEPFLNPDIIEMLNKSLELNFRVLVLTNAMKPMIRHAAQLKKLREKYGKKLMLRVSLDHYTSALHESERGLNSWKPVISGLKWLSENDFLVAVAGRSKWGESEKNTRSGYNQLFKELELNLDPWDSGQLVLFPEMDNAKNVPEITTACWKILKVEPSSMMCASSRMIIKKKGKMFPNVQACTLLPYDEMFSLGVTLDHSERKVFLNHPHCAKFCVLGGGSCNS